VGLKWDNARDTKCVRYSVSVKKWKFVRCMW